MEQKIVWKDGDRNKAVTGQIRESEDGLFFEVITESGQNLKIAKDCVICVFDVTKKGDKDV